MKLSVFSAVLFASVCAGSLAAQQFIPLPLGAFPTDITPDGTTIVGSWPGGDSFIWRWLEDPAPTVIPDGYIVAVSAGGDVCAGNIQDPIENAQVAARWTADNGWESIGWLPGALSCPSKSSAYDISGDGETIVGLSWSGCDARGFRWRQATGMVALATLASGGNRASAISDDGETIVGYAKGNFGRTPAYWGPGLTGAVLDVNYGGEVNGVTADGEWSVGTLYFSGSTNDAFLRDAGTGTIFNLGSLNGDAMSGVASDVSEDPLVSCGYDVLGLASEAWVWTADDDIQSLNDVLANAGVTGVPDLYRTTAISDDGNIIVGSGAVAGGGLGTSGFVVTLGDIPWTYLGNALAGSQGEPRLTGNGPLLGGSVTTLRLSDANPSGVAHLVLGVSALNAPFKGGVLVPSVDVILSSLPVDAEGALEFSFLWGLNFPSGASLWWQYWIPDAAGPLGWAASNGLQCTAP